MDRLKLGSNGEQKGTDFLRRKGYKILHRNFRTRSGEIDIIAEKNREIVFIEVKTRSSVNCGYPEEAVNRRKINHLLKASGYYLMKYNKDVPCRFEILSILADSKNGYSFDIIPIEM
ncbi:MAG TPA: YraN family protein [bacterium]|nr:YraN family protein [bacterium]